MTVAELLARTSSRELTEWQLFFTIKGEEAQPDVSIQDGSGALHTGDDEDEDEDDEA